MRIEFPTQEQALNWQKWRIFAKVSQQNHALCQIDDLNECDYTPNNLLTSVESEKGKPPTASKNTLRKNHCKWFEPRSTSVSYSVIIWVLVTDVSTTWAEVIFRVKWIVFVTQWWYKSGPLNVIGQFSCDGIGWKTRVKFVICHWSCLIRVLLVKLVGFWSIFC